jgi:MSHA biogenesis protein MshP
MKTEGTFIGLRRSAEAGFSMISAIFLLVVLAGLGVAMMTISTVQHHDTALDVQGVRAYQAARAGAEWGVYRYLNNPTSCSGTNSFTPPGESFTAFVVSVTCTPVNPIAGAATTRSALITSVACNQPVAGACPLGEDATARSADYVKRVVEVRLSPRTNNN